MSDKNVKEDNDGQYQTLNQFVFHPKDPSGALQVMFFGYEVDMTQLLHPQQPKPGHT